ncbi:Oxysterol-binding protein 4 [Dipsacomyces acuminosporus]|nr:Oxysterol-binding protein 4 [Dipsacomyces acuminosporus]
MTSDSKSISSTSSGSSSSGKVAAAAEPTGNIVPASHSSDFMSFLKGVLSFTGDLSALTCPSFLLNGISLLEYGAHWSDYPNVLGEITKAEDSAERMKLVARWFVSTLYGSYNKRVAESNAGEKKPFNPILGEQFLASWNDAEFGATTFICEQVSHHPPISAIYFENAKAGIYGNGHFSQKSKFKGTTMKVVQEGRVTLRMKNTDEIYCLSLPNLNICSIFTGKPFLEMSSTTFIRSSKGYTAEFQWHTKPWLYGEYHKFDGKIFKDSAAKYSEGSSAQEQLYTMKGKWVADSSVKNLKTSKEEVLFDVAAQPSADIILKPLEEQSELESRCVWNKVSVALAAGDYETASREKTAIEEEQRALRRKRAETNEVWKPSLFEWISDADDVADVKNSYAYLYSAKDSIGTGSWVYKKSAHLDSKAGESGSSGSNSNEQSGYQTPSDAFSTAQTSIA